MLRYSLTAAALGAGWIVVLLLPGMTRAWLLADIWLNLLFLVVTSVVVAIAGRHFIGRAETVGDHLVRAAVVPYLGCFVYLTFCAASLWIRSPWRRSLAPLHDTLSLYLWGMMTALLWCVIVVPYGLLCQYVMHSAYWSIRDLRGSSPHGHTL